MAAFEAMDGDETKKAVSSEISAYLLVATHWIAVALTAWVGRRLRVTFSPAAGGANPEQRRELLDNRDRRIPPAALNVADISAVDIRPVSVILLAPALRLGPDSLIQNRQMHANVTAARNTSAHRSYRVWMRRQSLRRAKRFSILCRCR